MGWWPRIALLTPEADRPRWARASTAERPPEILETLRKLGRRLPAAKWPEPVEALKVSVAPEALAAFERYHRALSYDMLASGAVHQRLWGIYGRLPVKALRVATMLAALDWSHGPSPKIDIEHFRRAVQITEAWRASAHRAWQQAAGAKQDTLYLRVLEDIARSGRAGITLRDLGRGFRNVPADPIERCVD